MTPIERIPQHTDAAFYVRHSFCRTDCEACDQLDQADMEVMTDSERLAKAVAMVVSSKDAGEDAMPSPLAVT